MGYVKVNLTVDDYTNRVLGVIKEKFGLKDKAQALVKFAHAYGGEFVEEQAGEEYVKKMLERCDAHVKKYGFKKMTDKELDELLEVN
ncbi:DUF2683 family protein [Candidatus Micrarchaeota archaeon]|nr:DUF2683 family protein [Candidatus Micrarchaeota archaeon]